MPFSSLAPFIMNHLDFFSRKLIKNGTTTNIFSLLQVLFGEKLLMYFFINVKKEEVFYS